jgi:hypothetical protein
MSIKGNGRSMIFIVASHRQWQRRDARKGVIDMPDQRICNEQGTRRKDVEVLQQSGEVRGDREKEEAHNGI